ncbi:MAG: hypothetical protein D6753_03180 [Planctomycetota bacterium]|nr:MAG: hypothetical protein D6753_03180 [Planctomycetota bacterium]
MPGKCVASLKPACRSRSSKGCGSNCNSMFTRRRLRPVYPIDVAGPCLPGESACLPERLAGTYQQPMQELLQEWRIVMDKLGWSTGACPGYRLSRMEFINWGTFDSTDGRVHTLELDGRSALLVGANGSGKSTIVDALLTLLVQPGIRNYNVAAGAKKRERDERTYIRGACGRVSDASQGVRTEYLRGDQHYTVLLATFTRGQSADAFTVAQVLQIDSDGTVSKTYAFDERPRSIADDLQDLRRGEKIRKQLIARGFRATERFSEYADWIAAKAHLRPRAMDVFNQTVAVKDIHSLNGFIREHMLEARPWRDRIDGLLMHFDQLNQGYQALVRARRQIELLEPIEAAARKLDAVDVERALLQQQIDAMDSFFQSRIVQLLRTELESSLRDAGRTSERLTDLDRELESLDETLRRLKNEIESVGGHRMRHLPLELEHQRSRLRAVQREQRRLVGWVKQAGLDLPTLDRETFAQLGEMLKKRQDELAEASTRTAERRLAVARSLADVRREAETVRDELRRLEGQTGNLPAELEQARRRVAERLGVEPVELPFPCELITVADSHLRWQPAVEMLLRDFATTLLVPRRMLDTVRDHVDRMTPPGSEGQGIELRYMAVADEEFNASGTNRWDETDSAVPLDVLIGQPVPQHSLLGALRIRGGHPLGGWLARELSRRFGVTCCESLDELVTAPAPAVTAGRHAKLHAQTYIKDDSPVACDARFYVLGGDMLPRIRQLRQRVVELQEYETALLDEVAELEAEARQISRQLAAIEQAAQYDDFKMIDIQGPQVAVEQLEAERHAIEHANDAVRILRSRLEDTQQRRSAAQAERDAAIAQISVLQGRAERSETILRRAEKILQQRADSGQLTDHQKMFAQLDAELGDRLNGCQDPTDILHLQSEVTQAYQQSLENLHRRSEPLREGIVRSMQRFLSENPHEADDLRADMEYLHGFLGLLEHLRREDLPRYERRFQVRLNEKTVQELGVFHGALQCESQSILDRIASLNESLAELEYRPGTYMRLDPRPTRDREITDFRAALQECLADAFDDDPQENESRFLRVQQLIQRLREEGRWRDKVTDVRQWFDFAAREIRACDGEEVSCYEDSAGQSGGEKAKLAFTILAAAIAYQFDLDPMDDADDRFRFVVVDEMFSKVDDRYAEYAMQLFEKFGLQLLIVAPLDAKARITEAYVSSFWHTIKDERSRQSQVVGLTAVEYASAVPGFNGDANRREGASRPWKPK